MRNSSRRLTLRPAPAPVGAGDASGTSRETKLDATIRALTALTEECVPGGVLPTVRELRTRLGVSSYTLDTAMAEMERRRILWRR